MYSVHLILFSQSNTGLSKTINIVFSLVSFKTMTEKLFIGFIDIGILRMHILYFSLELK